MSPSVKPSIKAMQNIRKFQMFRTDFPMRKERLKLLVPSMTDLINTIFLGFTRCGNFLISHKQSLTSETGESVGFWLFIPNRKLKKLEEWPVSMPYCGDMAENKLFACQWPFRFDHLVTFCIEYPAEELLSLECLSLEGCVTICPLPRLKFCQRCADSDDENICLRHQASIHRRFALVQPYPHVEPSVTINDPGRVFVNTGDSLLNFHVRFSTDDCEIQSCSDTADLPESLVKLTGNFITTEYWCSDGSVQYGSNHMRKPSDFEIKDKRQRKLSLDSCTEEISAKELGGLVIEESRVDMENLLVEICSQVCKMDGNLELAAMDDFEFHICHVNPEAQQMMAVGSVLLEGTNLTKSDVDGLMLQSARRFGTLLFGDFGFQLIWDYRNNKLVVTDLSSLTCHVHNLMKKPLNWNRHSNDTVVGRLIAKTGSLPKNEVQCVRELAVLDPDDPVRSLNDVSMSVSVVL